MSGEQQMRLAQEMGRSCLNMRARFLSRVITTVYDDELRPFGVKASQLNILAMIACSGPIRRIEIGKVLHLDSSTLTRNLRVMETNGWVEEIGDESDRRGSPVRLTAKGEGLIAKAAPAWRTAQRRAARLLGDDGKSALLDLTQELLELPA